jgi:hypothetical protein
MTDAITPANGHRPDAESARNARQDPHNMSGYDARTWEESMVASDSGRASAWHRRQPARPPQQPGVASPAGWFQPTGGEAAPPFRHGMESARSDKTAEPPGYAQASQAQSGHWYKDPQPTAVHRVPPLWPRTFQAQPPQVPVVGPTEALRGRAGGPGLTVPPGAVPGLPGPERRSGWQLAQQVWHDSGVSWEPASAAPAEPRPVGYGSDFARPADPPSERIESGDDPAAAWNESVEDWREPVEDRREPVEDGDEPADDDWDEPADHDWDGPAAGQPVDDGFEAAPAWRDAQAGRDAQAPTDTVWPEPVRPDAEWEPGPTGRMRRPAAGWSEYPTGGFPGQAWPMDATGAYPIQAPSPAVPPAFMTMPLGAPVAEAAPPGREAAPPRRGTAPRRLGEPDELFRAWQGSVRQAATPRRHWSVPWQGTTTRRHRAWQAATIGVPAAVIVTVGAGALLILTGKANEMLAVRADTGNLPSASADAGASNGGNDHGGRHATDVALAGYPGQRGAVAANSIWSAAGVSLAVGGADGHPAIWRRSGDAWTLVSAGVLGAIGGTGGLTAVAHGPAGWIAVGSTATGGSDAPLVLASADGMTWQPVAGLVNAAGSGVQFLGVAAGPDGYAVVGRQMIDGRTFATLWWSADLRMWVKDANGGLDGRLSASTANAAAATSTGFVAVGSHGAFASIWTSPDGAHWNLRNVPTPANARSATLRQVVTSGNTIVATGYAATKAGDIPLAVVSTDGGTHWRSVILPTPGNLGVVTALTAQGGTFIAAGQAGQAGARYSVTWTSPDGLSWPAGTQAIGVQQITALAVSAGTVTGTGIEKQGGDSAIMTFPAR